MTEKTRVRPAGITTALTPRRSERGPLAAPNRKRRKACREPIHEMELEDSEERKVVL
jgi:hypothetical protein